MYSYYLNTTYLMFLMIYLRKIKFLIHKVIHKFLDFFVEILL